MGVAGNTVTFTIPKPGQYVLANNRWFLTDLIGNAEGLGRMADPIAYMYRLKTGSSASEAKEGAADAAGFANEDVVKIDLIALMQGKAPEMNLELRGGDILYVRQGVPEHYYVVGEVNQPGVYEFSYGQNERLAALRVSQAVANAGGPARASKPSHALLVRSDANGVQKQIPFDFNAVLRGKQPDLEVQANDIIFIPGSQAKTIGYGMLGLIPNLATATAGVPVRR